MEERCQSGGVSFTSLANGGYATKEAVKPGPHQQQCRSNIVECYKSNDSFDKVETKWACSIYLHCIEMTKFHKKTRSTLLPKTSTMSKQHSTLLKGWNFRINSFDIVADFSNKVRCCLDKVERCFDIVAGVDASLRFLTIRSVNGDSPVRSVISTLLIGSQDLRSNNSDWPGSW